MGDTNHKIFLEIQKQNRKLIIIENMLETKLDKMISLLEKIHHLSIVDALTNVVERVE